MTNEVGERSPFRTWLLEADQQPDPGGFYEGERQATAHQHVRPWWKVMCLTGVDYFSTLGYQPGIAALAAGALAPIATLVLVLVTLFGALPMYRRVAKESPHGDGSLSMLERLLSYWPSKVLVLALIGFVATGFIITITLSAADASAHLVENPFLTDALHGREVVITLVLLAFLAAVFLKGFGEAIGIAVVLVVAYIGLSAVVVANGFWHIFQNPGTFTDWTNAVTEAHTSPLAVLGASLLVFPALALGLSGFETGVVVMPLVKGDPTDTPAEPTGRIRNTKKLLTTAALIMSVMLMGSAIVTTFLIPAAEFQPGGEANGRALAFLAHENLGDTFGTFYDAATIGILWFAGSSAMAGLLNIVPRYLPRYGMAPDWARAIRPLVLVFTFISIVVTIAFKADVNAQAGAYATGVLALMTSAAVAVTLTEWRRGHRRAGIFFGVVSAVFVYTITVTIIDRPEGLVIALIFIAMIVVISLFSRISRSTELRVQNVTFDKTARSLLDEVLEVAGHEDKRLFERQLSVSQGDGLAQHVLSLEPGQLVEPARPIQGVADPLAEGAQAAGGGRRTAGTSCRWHQDERRRLHGATTRPRVSSAAALQAESPADCRAGSARAAPAGCGPRPVELDSLGVHARAPSGALAGAQSQRGSGSMRSANVRNGAPRPLPGTSHRTGEPVEAATQADRTRSAAQGSDRSRAADQVLSEAADLVFDVLEVSAEVDAVDDQPYVRPDDVERVGVRLTGCVDEVTLAQAEPRAVGDELVDVRVGDLAVVVEQLVLGVGDGHRPVGVVEDEVGPDGQPTQGVQREHVLADESGGLLGQELLDQLLEQPGHVDDEAVRLRGVGPVLDAGVPEGDVGEVEQSVQSCVQSSGDPRGQLRSRRWQLSFAQQPVEPAQREPGGSGHIWKAQEGDRGGTQPSVVVRIEGPLIHGHLERHRQPEAAQVLLAHAQTSAQDRQGLVLGPVAPDGPGCHGAGGLLGEQDCQHRRQVSVRRVPEELGIDLQAPHPSRPGQQRQHLYGADLGCHADLQVSASHGAHGVLRRHVPPVDVGLDRHQAAPVQRCSLSLRQVHAEEALPLLEALELRVSHSAAHLRPPRCRARTRPASWRTGTTRRPCRAGRSGARATSGGALCATAGRGPRGCPVRDA